LRFLFFAISPDPILNLVARLKSGKEKTSHPVNVTWFSERHTGEDRKQKAYVLAPIVHQHSRDGNYGRSRKTGCSSQFGPSLEHRRTNFFKNLPEFPPSRFLERAPSGARFSLAT
jgi:hypothetical protein